MTGPTAAAPPSPARLRSGLAVGVLAVSWAAILVRLAAAPPLAIAAWRQRFYIRGALVASALLNLAVALSSLSSNIPLWSVVALLSAVIAGCGVLPSTAVALKRSRGDRHDDLPTV